MEGIVSLNFLRLKLFLRSARGGARYRLLAREHVDI